MMGGALAFAFGAGMLSTVNPCGFAMLPAFLAYYVGRDQAGTGTGPAVLRRALAGLWAGVLVSVGFAGVFTLAGALVAFGLRSVIGAVPWVAVLVGLLLAALGVAMLAGRHVGVRLGPGGIGRPGRGPGAMLAFGAAYAVASLSCTLAVLLAVVAQALAADSVPALAGVFAAYAAGASAVLVLLALSSALASTALARILHRASRHLPRISGAVLALSGAYLVAYWGPALATGQPDQGIARTMGALSGAAAGILGSNTALVAGLALAAVAVVLAAALLARARPRRAAASGGEPGPAGGAAAADCCAPEGPASPRDAARPAQEQGRDGQR